MRWFVLVAVGLFAVTTAAGPKKKEKEKVAPAAVVEPLAAPPVVVIGATTVSDEYSELEVQATEVLRREVSTFDVALVPEDADGGVPKGQGVTLQLKLEAAREQMRGTLLVTKLPYGGLRGSWFVHASGPEARELMEAVVPALVSEMSGDLGWKSNVVDGGAP